MFDSNFLPKRILRIDVYLRRDNGYWAKDVVGELVVTTAVITSMAGAVEMRADVKKAIPMHLAIEYLRYFLNFVYKKECLEASLPYVPEDTVAIADIEELGTLCVSGTGETFDVEETFNPN